MAMHGPSPISASRLAAADWSALRAALDEQGYAVLPGILSRAQCDGVRALYDHDAHFRSRIVMARHGFGRGEYRYFAYPLPPLVAQLREALYPPLAGIANAWNAALGNDTRYPPSLEAFLKRCHDAGQTRPTPLLLRYGQVDYLLSRPEAEFEGGAFVLAEQRPRMQSRVEVVPLSQGDGVIFPVNERPVMGARGPY